MTGEINSGGENEDRSDGYSWIGRIVKSQPEIVQTAYHTALTEAIRLTYSPQKEGIAHVEYIEEVKSKVLDVFDREMLAYKQNGLVPEGFDRVSFEFNLKTWMAFVDLKELNNASLDFMFRHKNNERLVTEWRVDPGFLKKLAKALHEAEEVTKKAFFLGNERAKLFRPNEIEEIKAEMDKLQRG